MNHDTCEKYIEKLEYLRATLSKSQDLKTVGRVVGKTDWGRNKDDNLYRQQEKVQNFFLHQMIDQCNPGTARPTAEIIEPPPVAFVLSSPNQSPLKGINLGDNKRYSMATQHNYWQLCWVTRKSTYLSHQLHHSK